MTEPMSKTKVYFVVQYRDDEETKEWRTATNHWTTEANARRFIKFYAKSKFMRVVKVTEEALP